MRLRLWLAGAVQALPLRALAHSGEHVEPADPVLPPLIVLAAGLLLAGFAYKKYGHAGLATGIAIVAVASGLVLGVAQPERQSVANSTHPALVGKRIDVYKSPGCSCCGGFISELKAQSAEVVVHDVSDAELSALKGRHGITSELESCHTSLVDGYVVEGHVPFEAIVKLTTERPEISGIALPGMPVGTPGMGGPKTEPYRIRTLSGDEYMTI